jgi:hypothetical protein
MATTTEPLVTAINKEQWRDFELLKAEHYNHNTAKSVPNFFFLIAALSAIT